MYRVLFVAIKTKIEKRKKIVNQFLSRSAAPSASQQILGLVGTYPRDGVLFYFSNAVLP